MYVHELYKCIKTNRQKSTLTNNTENKKSTAPQYIKTLSADKLLQRIKLWLKNIGLEQYSLWQR